MSVVGGGTVGRWEGLSAARSRLPSGCRGALPGVSVLSVMAQWEGLSAAPVSRQGAGCSACHPSLFNCHGPCHWHLALARVLAALAAQGRSNSGASVPRFSHAQQACQVCQCSQWWHSVSDGWWHSGKDSPPLLSTVRMLERSARCVSALSGGTVGRTVRRSRLPSGCRVQGMPPFPLQLPRTMPLASRPGPGPGGARCTGAQQFWGV